MSLGVYVQLIARMYQISSEQVHLVEESLTEKDRVAIDVTIAALANEPSGDRKQEIVNRYFGLHTERKPLKEVRQSLKPEISESRTFQLLGVALGYMRSSGTLRPLVERLIEKGVEKNQWLQATLDTSVPGKLITLKAKLTDSKLVGSIDWRSIPISDLGLSTPTSNWLSLEGIQTLGALHDKTDAELMRSAGYKKKFLQEIKDCLEFLGDSLDV